MFLKFLKLSPTDGGEGDAGAGGAGGGEGGQGEGGQGAAAQWFDAFDDIKSDPKLAETAGKYQSPAEALKAIGGWGENWRESIAGDNADLGKALQRYTTPKAVAEALVAAQEKIRTGQHKQPLPANANEQEIKAYREAHGIPETAEAYLEKLPDGLVIGDEDRPIFESFVKTLHAQNADPKIAHAAVKWYNEFVEEQQAQVAENDAGHKAESEDALRAEWGGDYRANVNVVETYLGTMPAEAAEALRGARGPDGRLLLHTPAVMQALAQSARELNGVVTITGIEGSVPAEKLDEAIAQIEKFMRTNRADYNKDEKLQAKLRGLYEARVKRDSKSRAA